MYANLISFRKEGSLPGCGTMATRVDVELVHLEAQDDNIGESIKVGDRVHLERRDSALYCSTAGGLLGSIPGKHVAALGGATAEGTIRSLKRGGAPPKVLTNVLVRFTFGTSFDEAKEQRGRFHYHLRLEN